MDISQPKRGIIFDLDGTLVDSAPATARALNEMLRRRGAPEIESAAVRPWVSLGGKAILRGVLGDQKDPLEDLLTEFRSILRSQNVDRSALYPGAASALATLRFEGYQIAVCTNKPEDIAIAYTADLGIAEYLNVVVGGAPDRHLKPDPQLAQMALEQLGVKRPDAILVGDSEIDAATARATGLRFVLVSFGYPIGNITEIEADARLDFFNALPRLAHNMFSMTEHRP